MSEFVFAFGSNMCSGRLRDYGVVPLGSGAPAKLSGFALTFDKLSKIDGSGKANVQPSKNDMVWGVLYEVSEADLELLDRGEGGGYRRQRVTVNTSDAAVSAWIYTAVKPKRSGAIKPHAWYLRFLVEGAREHGLPAHYIRALETLESTEDSDKTRDAAKRRLTCDGSSIPPAGTR
jgi:hypothetical protein